MTRYFTLKIPESSAGIMVNAAMAAVFRPQDPGPEPHRF